MYNSRPVVQLGTSKLDDTKKRGNYFILNDTQQSIRSFINLRHIDLLLNV